MNVTKHLRFKRSIITMETIADIPSSALHLHIIRHSSLIHRNLELSFTGFHGVNCRDNIQLGIVTRLVWLSCCRHSLLLHLDNLIMVTVTHHPSSNYEKKPALTLLQNLQGKQQKLKLDWNGMAAKETEENGEECSKTD